MRRTIRSQTFKAITEAATSHLAVPVITKRDTTDEVFLFRDGELKASIFTPEAGTIAFWRSDDGETRTADSTKEAVERALHTRKNLQIKV